MKVLIVPDKFKGTLTAQAAADSIASGWRDVRPNDTLDLLPMSDGGDGFGSVVSALLGAEARITATVNAAHQPHQSQWWWQAAEQTAVVESAQVIGLALLPPGRFHPFQLDTFGLGEMVRAAADTGARRFLFGIGGSATNDGGFGAARSLGWRFLGNHGKEIKEWIALTGLAHLMRPDHDIAAHLESTVAVDVQNPLLGPRGASRIYGPQKGLRPEDMSKAEDCLGRLAEIVERDLGLRARDEPGAGAAGGLGYGLRCFLGARLESGFDLFARYARLADRIRSAQWVVTAEGAIDESTLMGKGVGEVARRCREGAVPCLGLAGTLRLNPDEPSLPNPFHRLFGVAPHLTTQENAVREPSAWLRRLAAHAAREVAA